MITVSLVSHAHGDMVTRLIDQVSAFPEVTRIIVTLNLPEELGPHSEKCFFICNAKPKGFAANNNAAFLYCDTEFFCVLNPDIELPSNPFPRLLEAIDDPSVAVAAPLVINGEGGVEASARCFPTVASLVRKAFGGGREGYSVEADDEVLHPHWIAGMFMLFRSGDYRAVGGFDEKFFLYYEDVDVCARLWKRGRRIAMCPSAAAVHNARRSSHQYWRYRVWHARSMIRYFLHTPKLNKSGLGKPSAPWNDCCNGDDWK